MLDAHRILAPVVEHFFLSPAVTVTRECSIWRRLGSTTFKWEGSWCTGRGCEEIGFWAGRGSESTRMPVVEANALFDEALARRQSEKTPGRQVSRTEASVPRLWPELRGQLDEPPEHVSPTDSNSSGEDEGAVEPHTCASVGAHLASSCIDCSACVSGGVHRTSSCRVRSACAVVKSSCSPWKRFSSAALYKCHLILWAGGRVSLQSLWRKVIDLENEVTTREQENIF